VNEKKQKNFHRDQSNFTLLGGREFQTGRAWPFLGWSTDISVNVEVYFSASFSFVIPVFSTIFLGLMIVEGRGWNG
jgi:hypothetical protein